MRSVQFLESGVELFARSTCLLSKLDFFSHNTFDDKGQGPSMATHGGFVAFEDGREEWASYTEHLEQYFTANNINTAEKKRAILHQCMRSGKLTDISRPWGS